jgi:hypothetical protein
MTTLSRISMAAVAALFVGMVPAKAADLGGNCCADLEERVAELEATTARKGTRKVSLTISGQISQELLFWDDGIRDDMYVVGTGASNSRFRFTGSAKISPEITAGFLYEFQFYASANASVNQTNGGDDAGAVGLGAGGILREAMAWMEHSRLGRVSIGHGNMASTNAMLVDLSGKSMGAGNYIGLHAGGMFINNGTTYSDLTWVAFINGGGDWLVGRHEHIQYRTPSIAGFTLGASVGEDNIWDVALRYAGEFNGVRIAGALGYSVQSEFDGPAAVIGCATQCDKRIKQLAGSLSIRHMPTGLFFTGAGGTRDVDSHELTAGNPATAISFDADFWYASGGIAKNFFGIGDTVLYGEYGVYSGVGQDSRLGLAANGVDMDHWGVGIVQHIDAASMELWLTYKNLSLSGAIDANDQEDYHMIAAGTRIRF